MRRATVTLAALLTLVGSLVGQASAGAAPAATERLQSLDQALLSSVNDLRTAHGLRPLVIDPDLESAAVDHSTSMLESGYFEHESADGTSFASRVKRYYREAGFASWSAGENLLYKTKPVDAKVAMGAWLASPGHRHNLLDPGWRDIGIGSLYAASAGGTFGGEPVWVITMDFGARSGSSEKAVAKVSKTKSKARSKKKAKGHPAGNSKPTGAKPGKRAEPKRPEDPTQPTEPQAPFAPPTPPTEPADVPTPTAGTPDAAPPAGSHDGPFGDDESDDETPLPAGP